MNHNELTPRERQVLGLRGLRPSVSFVEIGRRLGVSAYTVKTIHLKALRKTSNAAMPLDTIGGSGLSTRAINALRNAGLSLSNNTNDVVKVLAIIKPPNIKNYGSKSHLEVLEWLQEHGSQAGSPGSRAIALLSLMLHSEEDAEKLQREAISILKAAESGPV